MGAEASFDSRGHAGRHASQRCQTNCNCIIATHKAPDVDGGRASLLPSFPPALVLVLPPLNMTDEKEEPLPVDTLEKWEDGARSSFFPCWLVMPHMQKRRVKGEERRTEARRNSGV